MKRYARGIAAAVVLLAAVALPASAVDVITIPIDTVIRSAEGELTTIAVVDVEAEAIGASCMVSADGENNASVHPSNDIIVSSGSDSVTLLDVEGVGGGTTHAEGTLTLGNTIVLTLRMGPDRVFSGGLTVTIDCAPPEETTTTTAPPEETTTTTAPPEETTTTTAPPEATSTSTTLPPETTTSDVRDQGTTTTAPVQVLGVQIEQGDELPFTGISTEVIAALGFGLIATGFMLRRLATESAESVD